MRQLKDFQFTWLNPLTPASGGIEAHVFLGYTLQCKETLRLLGLS